jgi:hypothetical protein
MKEQKNIENRRGHGRGMRSGIAEVAEAGVGTRVEKNLKRNNSRSVRRQHGLLVSSKQARGFSFTVHRAFISEILFTKGKTCRE